MPRHYQGTLDSGANSAHKVVKVAVFMTNIKGITKMDAVYRAYFSTNPPARACMDWRLRAWPAI